MAEEIYKAARLTRDLDPDTVEIEKFGALLRLGTSGALKSKGGMKAMGAAKKAKKTWGGMSSGAKMGTAAAAGGIGGGIIGSKLGS